MDTPVGDFQLVAGDEITADPAHADPHGARDRVPVDIAVLCGEPGRCARHQRCEDATRQTNGCARPGRGDDRDVARKQFEDAAVVQRVAGFADNRDNGPVIKLELGDAARLGDRFARRRELRGSAAGKQDEGLCRSVRRQTEDGGRDQQGPAAVAKR